jgi:fido (protein-threonine AMPylation protein)
LLGLEAEVFGFCAGFGVRFSRAQFRIVHRSFYTRVWRVGGRWRAERKSRGLKRDLFAAVTAGLEQLAEKCHG